MKQCHAWETNGVIVTPRPLRYPKEWPNLKPEEKGIDVALAIDFVALALDDEYDVGVLFSTDTDLIPALEFVSARFPGKHAEVAAWSSPTARSRLHLPERNVWCHWLKEEDHRAVEDPRDYNA